MPNYGINDRIVRWINKQAPGSVFTLTDAQDALNDDGGDSVSRDQVSTSVSRLIKYGIGIERRAQGLYLWKPSGAPKPSRRRGPRAPVAAGVTPLSIASGRTEAFTPPAPVVPVPEVPAPEAVTPPASVTTATAPADVPQDARLNGGGGFSTGEPVLLNVLAPLDDGGFIGQGDADGRVYSVKPVN